MSRQIPALSCFCNMRFRGAGLLSRCRICSTMTSIIFGLSDCFLPALTLCLPLTPSLLLINCAQPMPSCGRSCRRRLGREFSVRPQADRLTLSLRMCPSLPKFFAFFSHYLVRLARLSWPRILGPTAQVLTPARAGRKVLRARGKASPLANLFVFHQDLRGRAPIRTQAKRSASGMASKHAGKHVSGTDAHADCTSVASQVVGKRILRWTAPSGHNFKARPRRPDGRRALPCLLRLSLPPRQVYARARILARTHQLSLMRHILPLRKWMPKFCRTQSSLGIQPVRLALRTQCLRLQFLAKPPRLPFPARRPVRLECLVAARRPCPNQTCLILILPVRLEFVMAPSHPQAQLRFLRAILFRLLSHLCLVCRSHSFRMCFSHHLEDAALCFMHFSLRPGQLIAAPGHLCQ